MVKAKPKVRYGNPPDLSPYCVCEEKPLQPRIHLHICKKCKDYDTCWYREVRENFLSEHPDGVNPNAEEVDNE
jgi:hypothetical protein